MPEKKDLLWPYQLNTAFLLIPLIWLISALILMVTYRYLGWPDSESLASVLLVVLLISLLPLLLRTLDYLSSRRASVETQLFKVDFSYAALAQSSIQREPVRLPANIGIPGTAVPESGTQIIRVLEDVSGNEVVVVDIEEGDAWWVTRLLALSGGAVRAGSPKAIVFVGMVSHHPGAFLGWVRPADALKAILRSKEAYLDRYLRAKRIAQQLFIFGDDQIIPTNLTLQQDVLNYTYNFEYKERGEAAFEQVLMDQLKSTFSANPAVTLTPLEDPPDRLTLSRLNELFSHCLFQDQVDLDQPDEVQIETFLKSEAPYIALVRNKKYESMLERSAGERLILRSFYEAMIKKEATTS
jgi:hypothetical protein